MRRERGNRPECPGPGENSSRPVGGKHAKSSGKRAFPGRLRAMLLLILLVLATSLATAGTLAKYSSEFSVSANAQVASFSGSGTVNFDVALEDMVPGELKTVTFQVCNFQDGSFSDVAVDYEIQVESTGNLPLEFTLRGTKSGGMGTLAGSLDAGGKASGGELPFAEEGKGVSHSYELSVFWPYEESGEEYSHEIDMINVTVTAVQKDPGSGEQSSSSVSP